MRVRWITLLVAVGAMAPPLVAAAPESAPSAESGRAGAAPTELPVFHVVGTGLDADQAKALEASFDAPMHRMGDGSVRSISPGLGAVPLNRVEEHELGADEGGRKTAGMAFDLPAIQKLDVPSTEAAERNFNAGFAQAEVPLPRLDELESGHTRLHVRSNNGRTSINTPIDTTVNATFSLAGLPLVGPGAKARVTFGPTGFVNQLYVAVREVQRGELVPLILPEDAMRRCARRYPAGSRIGTPDLLYYAPPLRADDVGLLLPYYQCKGTGPNGGALVRALLPAVQGMAPRPRIDATLDGSRVTADGSVRGGTKPYQFEWQSMTTPLSPRASDGPSVDYKVAPRQATKTEVLWLTVTDANGLTGSARVVLDLGRAVQPRVTFEPESVSQLDVGGEFNVWEWQCVKDSYNGFTSVFNGQSIPIAFRWTGMNAWERDFRESSSPQNGNDSNYIDNVDLGWYTGHGSPGSFTFDNATKDDGNIVPNDARWGNRDLEWLQLESCNVLQFDSGGTPIWDRWAKTFDGLHLLNGFQTTAACVNVGGGTAGRFSRYLFPSFAGIVPALRVRQAWAQMAVELEPSGRQYVTMGAAGPGWITNYNDYFWGEGSVGPDIPKSQIIGYWWTVGTV